MALPLSLNDFLANLGDQSLLGIHLLEVAVLFLDFLHTLHQRGIHAAKFGSLLIKRRAAHAMLSASFRDRQAALNLFQDGLYLAIGKSWCLLAEFPRQILRENSTCEQSHLPGRLPISAQQTLVQKLQIQLRRSYRTIRAI